jgi:hypothetical protein
MMVARHDDASPAHDHLARGRLVRWESLGDSEQSRQQKEQKTGFA